MKPRLLFLNNFKENHIPERLDRYFETLGFDVDVRHAWSEQTPMSVSDYQAVFLSGSEISPWEDFPWVQEQIKLVHKIAQAQIPTLGVCFGSQIIPYALCGPQTVFRRDNHEIGLIELRATELMAADPIGVNLPADFPIFSWHQDEIIADHPDLLVLARSSVCANHIWRYRDLPLWGIQAHPEAGNLHSKPWLAHHGLMLKKAGLDLYTPKYIDGVVTPDAMELINNFASFVLAGNGHTRDE